MPKVTANPLIGPEPIRNKINAAINVVMFASITAVFDRSYPLSKAIISSKSLINEFIRFVPMKPAPPVTRILDNA